MRLSFFCKNPHRLECFKIDKFIAKSVNDFLEKMGKYGQLSITYVIYKIGQKAKKRA